MTSAFQPVVRKPSLDHRDFQSRLSPGPTPGAHGGQATRREYRSLSSDHHHHVTTTSGIFNFHQLAATASSPTNESSSPSSLVDIISNSSQHQQYGSNFDLNTTTSANLVLPPSPRPRSVSRTPSSASSSKCLRCLSTNQKPAFRTTLSALDESSEASSICINNEWPLAFE